MYKPNPIDTSSIVLPEELLELTEKIAENVHENWSAGRIAQGWTYGEKRDDEKKTTPCLVPYSKLTETEKEYDRVTAIETLKLIVALGYEISEKKTKKVQKAGCKVKSIEAYTEGFKAKYEKFINGCDSIEEIEKWDKKAYGEMESFYANDITSIIIRIIAADGIISQHEVDYINKAFGFEYTLDELTEVHKNCIDNIDEAFDENFENGISLMRRINSKLADAYKELLCMICDIIISSDGVVSQAETAELERLKAMCS